MSHSAKQIQHAEFTGQWSFIVRSSIEISSAPNNAQLRVDYAQILILMYRLEIRVSSWHTHIFEASETVDSHLVQQWNQTGKVRNAKLCLPNHTPVHDADWFKSFLAVVFQSWLVRNSLSFCAVISFLCLSFHFDWKHVTFTWFTRTKKHLAAKSDENIIVEGERRIKAAEKDPSATVVASVRLTGANVVGSINETEFWQRLT